MDVILRNYVRAAEENEILYTEVLDLREMMMTLMSENSDLRLQLSEAGIEPKHKPQTFNLED